MNVTAHQEKEENEETKKGKRRVGEKKKRKQATDFKEAVCRPSAVVQGAARRKIKGECPGNRDPREGQQPFLPNPNGVGDRTNTFRRLLIGAGDHYRHVTRSSALIAKTYYCFIIIMRVRRAALKASAGRTLENTDLDGAPATNLLQ